MISTETRTDLATGMIALFMGAILAGANLGASPVYAQSMDAETTPAEPKIVQTADAEEAGLAETSIEDGKALVELNCSGCHAVGARDASPHKEAPAFRTILQRYPIDAWKRHLIPG